MSFDVATDSMETIFQFIGMKPKPNSEAVRVPKHVSRSEDDTLFFKQRPAEFLSTIEVLWNCWERIDPCRLEPVELIPFDELGDTFSVLACMGPVCLNNRRLLFTECLFGNVLTNERW